MISKPILSSCGDVTADLAKGLRAFLSAKAARHLLFQLDHPQVSFGQVVVKRLGSFLLILPSDKD
jgi:hypothetical protein